MTDEVKCDKHCRDHPAACDAPVAGLEAVSGGADAGAVVELGCGLRRELQGLQVVQYEANTFIVEKRGTQIWHLPGLQLSL